VEQYSHPVSEVGILNPTACIECCLWGDWFGITKTTNPCIIYPPFTIFEWVGIIRWYVINNARKDGIGGP
jgi:hypothetical protein